MQVDLLTQIKTTVDKALEAGELAGMNMMLLKDGKEIIYHEAGFSKVETSEPITRQTMFRLYSMTKPITAVAVMILMERGRLDLFDSVGKYLPSFVNQKAVAERSLEEVHRDMTIMDLLNMTSGLLYPGEGVAGEGVSSVFEEIDRGLMGDQPLTTMEIALALGKVPLAYQPGTSWSYGASADILGAIIEVVDGRSFRDFLMEEIFNPLDMKETDFYVPDDKQERLANVYETTEGKTLERYYGNHLGIINKMDRIPAFASGGAGLVATIDDYGRFASMLISGGSLEGIRILNTETVRYLTNHHLSVEQSKDFEDWHTLVGHSYGNLMRIVHRPELAGGIVRKGEYGWDGWLGCYLANFPDQQMTLLIMMQKKDAGTTTLTRKIRNMVLSQSGV